MRATGSIQAETNDVLQWAEFYIIHTHGYNIQYVYTYKYIKKCMPFNTSYRLCSKKKLSQGQIAFGYADHQGR